MNVAVINNTRTHQEWAKIINDDWRKSIEGIIQTGRDLISAKAELPLGEWEKMVENDLPFGTSTAGSLRRIAKHPVISNRHDNGDIPMRWTTLVELSSLNELQFKDAQEKNLITSDIGQHEAAAIVKAYKSPENEVVGQGRKPQNLPSPDAARKIARETKRLIAASDGNVYSGATKEEGQEHNDRVSRLYRIIDAVDHIDDLPVDAFELLEQAPSYSLVRLDLNKLQYAAEYLTSLTEALKDRKGIIDA